MRRREVQHPAPALGLKSHEEQPPPAPASSAAQDGPQAPRPGTDGATAAPAPPPARPARPGHRFVTAAPGVGNGPWGAPNALKTPWSGSATRREETQGRSPVRHPEPAGHLALSSPPGATKQCPALARVPRHDGARVGGQEPERCRVTRAKPSAPEPRLRNGPAHQPHGGPAPANALVK